MEENNENLTEIYNDNQDNQDDQDNQDIQDIQEKKRKKTNYVLTPARKEQLVKMNQARKKKIEEKKNYNLLKLLKKNVTYGLKNLRGFANQ